MGRAGAGKIKGVKLKGYQVLNSFGNPASEEHMAIYGTKEQAEEYAEEVRQECPGEKFDVVPVVIKRE